MVFETCQYLDYESRGNEICFNLLRQLNQQKQMSHNTTEVTELAISCQHLPKSASFENAG
jgi:hypothetical protein